MNLPRCYPIVDSAAWVKRLVDNGAKLIQLRMKSEQYSAAQLRQQIRQAHQYCQAHQAWLVINDHWQLAIEESCAWLHLGQEDLHSADLKAVRQAGLKLGISTHSHAELDNALAAQPDYIALGPIWATKTKQMPWQPQGLERIGEWKQRIGHIPLVAIGGISVERAAAVLSAGADCVAMISDICAHAYPEQRLKQWLQICQ